MSDFSFILYASLYSDVFSFIIRMLRILVTLCLVSR